MGARLNWIPAQFIKVATAYRLDLPQFLIGGIYLAPGSTAGVVRLWKVNIQDMSNAGEIPFSNDAGKDDSVALEILADGAVLITIAEAVPGGGGATSQPEVYRINAVFPAYSSAGGIDQATLARLSRVEALAAGHEARLDKIASGAAG